MNIELLGVPMDLGSGRRGVDMGPSALRIAGVTAALSARGHRVTDAGDLDIKNMEEIPVGSRKARYLKEIARASTLLGPVARGQRRVLFETVVEGEDRERVGRTAVAFRHGVGIGDPAPVHGDVVSEHPTDAALDALGGCRFVFERNPA